MNPFSSALAPVSPVSSSTVKRHSIGPCSISSDARIASSAATPMPLSAPRVVPLARSQFPSTIVSIGSWSKSCAVPLFFSQTISMWDCKTTVGRFSLPGVADLDIRMLPTASFLIAILYCLANDSRNSIIFPSFFEGRGTCVTWWKNFQTISGFKSVIFIMLQCIIDVTL
ncbi:uncharacterized protein BN675_02843 [Parabacteroides merdae CAG:48]|nr:uncharacterized protein BN675_02843 [Parabacteroides merdae CAG:48]